MRLLGSNGQYSRYPLAYFLQTMERLGLHQLDFIPQVPHFFCGYRDHADPRPLQTALREAGMQVSALTPPSYRCSLTAPAGEQREATRSYYKSCIRLAAELSCDRMVLGAAGACWDIPAQDLTENAAAMLTDLCKTAETEGVQLLLVPVMGGDTPLIAEAPVLNTAAELEDMLRRVDSPALGVCLDTNSMSAANDTIPDWMTRFSGRIGLVRLCDGNRHGWRAWGDGVLPMDIYLHQLRQSGYDGDVSLYLPGERYIETPSYPDEVTMRAWKEAAV